MPTNTFSGSARTKPTTPSTSTILTPSSPNLTTIRSIPRTMTHLTIPTRQVGYFCTLSTRRAFPIPIRSNLDARTHPFKSMRNQDNPSNTHTNSAPGLRLPLLLLLVHHHHHLLLHILLPHRPRARPPQTQPQQPCHHHHPSLPLPQPLPLLHLHLPMPNLALLPALLFQHLSLRSALFWHCSWLFSHCAAWWGGGGEGVYRCAWAYCWYVQRVPDYYYA